MALASKTKPILNNSLLAFKRKFGHGNSDLIENRRPKHKVSNVKRREKSQTPYYDWNQAQGSKFEDSNDGLIGANECLKASIWNKPDDDPRFILRIGTSKIRSHSEDHKAKTFEDEEKEKEQFAMYCKEVERRFKRSKLKNFKFPLKEDQSLKKTHIKSRNQKEINEKFVKLTDLFDQIKTQRTIENLSSIMTSSVDSERRQINRSHSKRNFESTSKIKRIKNTKTNSFKFNENSKHLYLKYSMSSGSFDKMKAFEKPLLKQLKPKTHRRFMVERKQINLQSSSRDNSAKRLPSLTKTKPKTITLPEFKSDSRNVGITNPVSRNLKSQQILKRTKSGVNILMKKRLGNRTITDHGQNTSSHKSINQSGTSKLYFKICLSCKLSI